MSKEERKKRLLDDDENDTTQNEEIKFSKLDSLRHSFDTHRNVKKTEYIGGIFARGGVTAIVGASGVGKTTFLQRMFHDLSIGGEIFGDFWTEYKKRKSIIIAAELGEDGLTERAQEFNWHSDTEYVEVIDMLEYEDAEITFNLNELEGQANIEHLAQTPNLDLIVFDSFGMFYTGKENDNDALRATFRFLLRIARRYNIAVAVIHHSRKRLSNEQFKPLTLDDMIGGNAIARYCHRVIAIEYMPLYQANVVTCLKSWGAFFKPFSYKKITGLYGHSRLEINIDLKEIEEAPAKKKTASEAETHSEMILTILKAKENNTATTKELRELLDIDEKNANNLAQTLRRMTDNGEITRAKHGVYALPKNETEAKISQTGEETLDLNFDSESE